MDDETKEKVIKQITSMIRESNRFECNIDFGIEKVVNINNGMVEHAYNGEVSICLNLYLEKNDKRHDLFIKCATRSGE